MPYPQTAQEWCAHHGVEVTDGVATLFKAVDADFNSYRGLSYAPGSLPQRTGLGRRRAGVRRRHPSLPRPGLALARSYGAQRFVACPVRVEDIAVYPGGDYKDVVKVPGVCAPVYEVDELGRPR